MSRRAAVAASVCLAALAMGCFETKQEYTINPDGSGKVACELAMQDMAAAMTPDAPPASEDQIRQTARQIVSQSRGIEAWKDVSFGRAEDGRIRFKGTAYFKDLSAFRVSQGGPSGMTLTKDDKGGLVLALEEGKGKEKEKGSGEAPPQLTEEEITKRIADHRARWQQQRPMLAMVLGTMKMDLRFRLPGTLAEVTNFAKGDDGTLRLLFEGPKLLEGMDQLTANDAAMHEIVAAGESLGEGGPKAGLLMNEKMFGSKESPRVRMTGDLKPLFDYKAEMEAAKAVQPEMMKKLGLDQPPAEPAMPPDFLQGTPPGGGAAPAK